MILKLSIITKTKLRVFMIFTDMLLLLCLPLFMYAGIEIPLSFECNQSTDALIHSDTARIHKLCRQALEYRKTDTARAFAYARKALFLSDSLDYLPGKGKAWYTLGRIHRTHFALTDARHAYLKADSIFTDTGTLTEQADIKNKIGITYGMQGYYNRAITYFNKSWELYDKLGNLQKTADCLNNLGNVYKYQGYYNQSVSAYIQAMDVYEKGRDTAGVAMCNDHIGIVYDLQGNYPEALDYYFKSLRLREQVGDTVQIAQSFGNIGIIFYYLGDYEKALEYQQKNLQLCRKTGEIRGEGIAYINMGNIYEKQGRLNDALEQYQKALNILEKMGERHALADTYLNIARIYIRQKKTSGALSLLQEDLKLSETLQYKQGIGNSCLYLGMVLLTGRDYRKSEKYFLQALHLGKEIGMPEIVLSASEGLSQLYALQKKYPQAYSYHVIFKQMNDSLINLDNARNLTRMEMQYLFDKKQDSIQMVQTSKDMQNTLKLRRQKRQLHYLAAGMLAFLIMIILIYRIYRQKKKANAEKEVLLKEIHHRVKNNLQTITSLLSHQGYAVGNIDIQTAMEESQGRVQSIALIHQMLYQNENLKNINIQEYIENLVQFIDNMFHTQDNNIEFQVNANNVFMDIDTAIPVGLMVNELVTNACKYAFHGRSGGTVRIEIDKTGDTGYKMSVGDNGIGMPEIYLSETPDTLGLKLVAILAKQLKGKVEFYPGHGTEIIILFREVMKSS